MPDSSTILLVDDEDSVQKLLTYPLERDGFRVVSARGRRGGARLFASRASTSSSSTSCCRSSTASRSASGCGRELGADHHAHRPRRRVRHGARARARRRRLHHEAVLDPRVSEPGPGAPQARRRAAPRRAGGGAARRGDVSLDPTGGLRGGRQGVDLTYVEFELLRTLVAQPGRVFSRRALLQAIWGDSAYREPRTIDVHVRHLREKIEQDPSEPELILTVRGAGYRLREP